jgi:hypothetical protein
MLIPLSFVAPSTKALAAGVVAREMAVLDQPLLVVTTGNEGNLFVVAHLGCGGEVDVLVATALLNYFRHQYYIFVDNA